MNSRKTTNSQLSTTEAKNKNKLSKQLQLEQEQTHRNGDHRQGSQSAGQRGRLEKNETTVIV